MSVKLTLTVILLTLVACAAEATPTPIPPAPTPTLTSSPTASPTFIPTPTTTPTPTRTKTAAPSRTPTPLRPTRVNTPFGDSRASGARLFHDYLCDSCHYTERPFPGGFYAPNLGNISSEAERIIRLPEYRGKATNAADYIRESVLEPNMYIVPGENYLEKPDVSAMYQNFAQEMAPADLDALVAYLLSLKSKAAQ